MPSTTPHVSPFAPHCDECPHRLTGVEDPDPKVIWRACQCVHHARCSQCGWPITDDNSRSDYHDLCAMCDTDDLMRGRPPEDRHELQALLAALGLPPNVPVAFQLLHGAELDDDWGDYRIEWAVIPDVAWQYAHFSSTRHHPWRVQMPGWETPQIILRWRQWCVDAPEYLERSWQRQGARWVHHWQVHTTNQLPSPRRVREFAELIGEHKGVGRPPDDLDAWLDELRLEIAATIDDGQRPDQATLAARLGYRSTAFVTKFAKLNTHRRNTGRKPIRWRHLVTTVEAAMRRE